MQIAIASGKGGTGKTTLSTNLAVYLKKELNKNVILADVDVEEPDSSLFFKIKEKKTTVQYTHIPVCDDSKCTLCGKCSEICNFNALAQIPSSLLIFKELCHSCYACSDLCEFDALSMQPSRIGVINSYETEFITLIEGKVDVGIEQAVPMIKKVKNYIADTFEPETIMLLDSPPGTSCPMIEVVRDVDFLVLVTEPTPFGLHDLKLAAETAVKLSRPFGIVINRSDGTEDIVELWAKENNVNVLGRIPEKREIAELYSKGSLIYDSVPEFGSELKSIYKNIEKVIR